MNIYDNNGWLNVPEIITSGKRLIVIIGARGIGKTFGFMKYLYENNVYFLWLRSEVKETEFLMNDEMNIFNDLPDSNVHCKRLNEYYGEFYKQNGDVKEQIGLLGSLATVGKTRGFGGAKKIKVVIYDEFIPEEGKPQRKSQGMEVANAYETINRNRELNGKEPLIWVCLSNSNTLDNDVLTEFNILDLHDHLKNDVAMNDKVLLIEPHASPISYKKQLTGLYGLSKRFDSMAIGNRFLGSYDGNIRPMSLKRAELWFSYDQLYFYKFTDTNYIYVTKYKKPNSKVVFEFNNSNYEIKKFKKDYFFLWRLYLSGLIRFETSHCEALFNKIFEKQ